MESYQLIARTHLDVVLAEHTEDYQRWDLNRTNSDTFEVLETLGSVHMNHGSDGLFTVSWSQVCGSYRILAKGCSEKTALLHAAAALESWRT